MPNTTAGCLAATAGVACTTVMLMHSSAVLMPADAATKYFDQCFSHIVPGATVALATSIIGAVVQSGKTPESKAEWLGAAALFASFFPYTAVIMKPTANRIMDAADEDKAASEEDFKFISRHSLIRAALLGAGTVLSIYALIPKKR
ncbi:hypothetical protein HYH03_011624 [Edaphochlamys debaryana]|uniref:DUF4149 domain-containing protein n=1 Tax=Edaphochlamys debaryana TaxID=47281 RepID=A0A835XX51_9CHLO|nr:hypothetical protein HYH03_011624 [Edaphochlamys debaryana]|eukprot:KAG2489996.1 hypothetical protein HYH03_011624 [Edaphochlamys debaryana]